MDGVNAERASADSLPEQPLLDLLAAAEGLLLELHRRQLQIRIFRALHVGTLLAAGSAVAVVFALATGPVEVTASAVAVLVAFALLGVAVVERILVAPQRNLIRPDEEVVGQLADEIREYQSVLRRDSPLGLHVHRVTEIRLSRFPIGKL